MKLQKDDKAIAFSTEDISGNTISLESYRGKKVYITFYRGASCPFCNLRVNKLLEKMKSFDEKGLIVIGFFMSAKEEIMEYVGKQKPPFPIIPDPDKIFYMQYGLESSLTGKMKSMLRFGDIKKIFANGYMNTRTLKDDNTLPGDFLIDEEGKIHVAHYAKDFGDHLDFKIILDWINKSIN
ncbi:MAG: redoxin domain-containing protein [Bacteroidales bacterium]|nr:redoxin domain-containing protein [Bacteroidales bacterium]